MTRQNSTVQRKRSHFAPGSLKAPVFPTLLKQVKARGRKGTSTIHFHRLVPWSSSHIGPRNKAQSFVHPIRGLIMPISHGGMLFREYCFGRETSLSSAANLVSSERSSVWHTNKRLRGTHWVRSRNSVSPTKLTELGVWNCAPRNRFRPVSDKRGHNAPKSKTSRGWPLENHFGDSAWGKCRESLREFIRGRLWGGGMSKNKWGWSETVLCGGLLGRFPPSLLFTSPPPDIFVVPG